MVRPNQIIESDVDAGTLTFIMFAQSEKQVKRRVLLLNFPGKYIKSKLKGEEPLDSVESVQTVSRGKVNRYAVTVKPANI